MIEITDKAKEQLRKFSEDEGIGHLNIRISVKGSGCAGLSHDMIFDDLQPTDQDEIFKIDDIIVYIDCLSLSYMGETTIDFVESEFAKGFQFLGSGNKSCGCGSSFSV